MRIIGIAGPSCSGKTTIAERLARELDAQLISADLTYIRGSERPIVVGDDGREYDSFERPSLYDLRSIATALAAVERDGTAKLRLLDWATKQHYSIELVRDRPIVIEGFGIFTDPELSARIGEKHWIDVPVEETIRRRSARGGRKSDLAYARIARSERHWIEGQKDVAGVAVHDGTLPIETITDAILGDEQND